MLGPLEVIPSLNATKTSSALSSSQVGEQGSRDCLAPPAYKADSHEALSSIIIFLTLQGEDNEARDANWYKAAEIK